MDSPLDAPLRKKQQRYVGSNPFQNGQYDFEKSVIDAKDQEYYDELKLRSTKLILDQFGSEFPSLDEMKEFNSAYSAKNADIMEQRLHDAKEEHDEHLRILAHFRDADVEALVRSYWLGYDESISDASHETKLCDALQHDQFTLRNEHDDLLAHVNHAHFQRITQIQRYRHKVALQTPLSSTSTTTRAIDKIGLAALEKLTDLSKRFPSSVDGFHKMRVFPEVQRRVARVLCETDIAKREDILSGGDPKWSAADTIVLSAIFKTNETFRKQVEDVIANIDDGSTVASSREA